MDKITTENLNTNEDFLSIRCPECLFSYIVKEDSIQSVYPEFTCKECQCHFAFEYPVVDKSSVITFKVVPTQFEFKKKCPKCDFVQSEKNEICNACGVVIEHYLLKQKETYPRVSIDLIKQWNELLTQFENGLLHELFISTCSAKNKLDYAEFKYNELGRSAGDTSLTLPWLRKINPRKYDPEWVKSEALQAQIKKEINQVGWLPEHVAVSVRNVFDQVIKKNWIPFLGTLAGLLLIVTGLTSSSQRNQVGIGIALLISVAGYYVLAKKKIS